MYLLIAGNKNASLDWSVICQKNSWDQEEIDDEADNFLHCDFCYCVDGDEGRVIRDYKIPTWGNRDSADTAAAIKIISQRLSELSLREPSVSALREIEEYAKTKGVPFSAELHIQFAREFTMENPYWDSSSASC